MAGAAGPPAGTAPDHDPNAVYALGSSPGESARLQRQADELAVFNAALLDRADPRPGQSAIDLGCGPRGILDLLAERVSPGGRVVGLDANPAHTAMAAEFAAARGLSGVETMTADARRTGLLAGSFDLVHARTLLVNVPEPADVAAEMMRLARPGGMVASMEPDTEHARCYPRHPAFDRLCEIFTVTFRRNGADPWIGRRVPHLLRQAGLEDVHVEARVQLFPAGNSRRTIMLDLVRSMRPQVLELGLATPAELDEMDAAARAHVLDPDTVATWGRTPDRRESPDGSGAGGLSSGTCGLSASRSPSLQSVADEGIGAEGHAVTGPSPCRRRSGWRSLSRRGRSPSPSMPSPGSRCSQPWWRGRSRWKGVPSTLPLRHDRQVHAAGDGPGLV
jgi:SAM-dependent methyltransferase